MGVNDTALLEYNKRDIGFANDKLDGQLVLTTLFAASTVVPATPAVLTLFALDATGGSVKDVKFAFWLNDEIAATYTVSVFKTSADDLVTFVQDFVKTWTIALPGFDGVYSFEAGDLEEGLQIEIRVWKDSAGTNAIRGTLTYLG